MKVYPRVKTRLEEKVIGQYEAKREILKMVRRIDAGLVERHRPVAATFLCGPTGIGKTHIVQTLAEGLHGTPLLLRIDCGTMQMDHEVARLVGAPPGYIGHRETQPIVTNTKLSSVRSPDCDIAVVLFDEFEKATPRLQDMLLSVLDDGHLLLGDGTRVRFDRTWIFFTSNVGAREAQPSFGFQKNAQNGAYITAVRKLLLPEFIGRLTHIIVCKALTEDEIEDIIRRELRLAKEEWHLIDDLSIKASALRAMVELIRSEANLYGARRVRRFVRDALADALLESGTDAPITIYHEDGRFIAMRRSA